MSFSVIIFVAALWALSSEMIEDSLVDLIYGHMFGWRNLVYALVTASIILATISSFLIYYASSLLLAYIDLVTKSAAVLLGAIGIFWLGSSILGKRVESQVDEIRKRREGRRSNSFLITLQLVSVEELEILLVLIPLVIASHTLEASAAAAVGIAASASLGLLIRKDFERFVLGKLRYLKIISGVFLAALGVVLFFEV